MKDFRGIALRGADLASASAGWTTRFPLAPMVKTECQGKPAHTKLCWPIANLICTVRVGERHVVRLNPVQWGTGLQLC